MLHRTRNIFIFLALAVIVISTCLQISLASFNQDIGYPQPIKAFECYRTTEGWYISILNCGATVVLDDFPVEQCQQYQQIALEKIANWWQQAVNSNPLETVRCLTKDIVDKVDSR